MKLLDRANTQTVAESTAFLPNRNLDWLQTKGSWIIHIYVVVFGKLLFSVLPGISSEASWTLANLFYNMASFIVFHWLVGTPFGDCPQTGQEYDSLTLWEQIDAGEQFTPTKKFLTAVPIMLFLLSMHYSHFDAITFSVNFLSLFVNLIGKLPIMDRVRLFGINKTK